MRDGVVRAFNFTEFVGELFTSAFAGLLTFFLCEWSGLSPLLSAVLIGISGHMGSRAIFGIERWAEKRVTGMRGP
jgi:predicted CDP-diglyceride synthetase/phosphatidate cytidylyltransferase